MLQMASMYREVLLQMKARTAGYTQTNDPARGGGGGVDLINDALLHDATGLVDDWEKYKVRNVLRGPRLRQSADAAGQPSRGLAINRVQHGWDRLRKGLPQEGSPQFEGRMQRERGGAVHLRRQPQLLRGGQPRLLARLLDEGGHRRVGRPPPPADPPASGVGNGGLEIHLVCPNGYQPC